MSSNVLQSSNHLNMANNQFYQDLVRIDLSNNHLQTLDPQSLRLSKCGTDPHKCSLDLRSNRFDHLPNWFLKKSLNFKVFLSGNPFDCNCTAINKFNNFFRNNSD